jgi:hypothetical protein
MNDKKYLFEEDSVWHALAVMALPAIASQFITLVYNIADTWFVGRTNNPYMVAACSLVLPVHLKEEAHSGNAHDRNYDSLTSFPVMCSGVSSRHWTRGRAFFSSF